MLRFYQIHVSFAKAYHFRLVKKCPRKGKERKTSYPEVSDVTVTSLITIPTMFALVFSFIIGPLAMRFNKVALMTIVMCCMGAYSLIFFFNGLMHGPFFLYTVACALAGFAQGGFAPLMNTIIGENFESEARAGRIAVYNVANNCAAFEIICVSAWPVLLRDHSNLSGDD